MVIRARRQAGSAAGRPNTPAIAISLLALAVIAFGAWYYVTRLSTTGAAISAADGFFGALQAHDWKRVYSLLPVEPQTTHVGNATVTSNISLTEDQFIRNMQTKGIMGVGTDFTVKYRILGAVATGPDEVKVRIGYAVGGAEQVRVYDIDFSKPNGVGQYRGNQPARLLSNTEDLVFKRINGKWKYDMWQPNSFGFMPL